MRFWTSFWRKEEHYHLEDESLRPHLCIYKLRQRTVDVVLDVPATIRKQGSKLSLAAQADGWFIGELCYVVRSSGVPFLDMTPRGRVHAGLVRASRFLRNQRR